MIKHRSLRKQSGVVIIIALFVVALAASMAYVMLARLTRDTYRTSMILQNVQAEFYAQGSIAWAMDELRNNWIKQKPDQLVDKIPIVLPKATINGYTIESSVTDAQARMNINNLVNAESQQTFKQLLKLIDPSLTEQQTQTLLLGVIDWITIDTEQQKFSDYYKSLTNPYRQPHQRMVSISELNHVKGMNRSLFKRLKPFLIALPAETPINVQTAEAPVLASLSSTMSLESGKNLIIARKEKPFITQQNFLDNDLIKNHALSEKKITTVSSYFLVETHVNIGQQKIVLYSLVERLVKDSHPSIRIVWQSKQSDD